MRWRVVLGNVGIILRGFPVALIPPIMIAVLMDARDTAILGIPVPSTVVAYLWTGAGSLVLGVGLSSFVRVPDLRESEAYVLVGVGWITVTMVAAVPFLLSSTLPSPIDALYEAMSGLTTTGYSVVPGPLEDIQPSMNFWRAETQWIGGMGIIVLTVAVLRGLATSGARLMRAEVPGGSVVRLRPRVASTAKALWFVYGGITLASILALLPVFTIDLGLPFGQALYESVVHAFTALATGGFSTRSASIAAFDSAALEWTIIVIMVLGGTNFALHFDLMRGRPMRMLRDEEFRFYLLIVAAGALLVFAVLMAAAGGSAAADRGAGSGWSHNLRAATFQFVSASVNAGLTTVDYQLWPATARFIILFAMFVGGCTGSTGGSIKVVRVLLAFKLVRAELVRIGHPRAMVPVRLGGVMMGNDLLRRTMAFVFMYLTCFIVGTLGLLVFTGLDIVGAASFAAGSLGNVGASFGGLPPDFRYAGLPTAAKLISIFLMWLGRLEVFAILVLFAPRSWK